MTAMDANKDVFLSSLFGRRLALHAAPLIAVVRSLSEWALLLLGVRGVFEAVSLSHAAADILNCEY